MKDKITITSAVFLFLMIFIANLTVVTSFNKTYLNNPDCDREEIYLTYGIDFYSISGGFWDDWKEWGEHGVELSPSAGTATAEYRICIGCSNKNNVENFEIGVRFKEIGKCDIAGFVAGPSIYLYNFNTYDWDLIAEAVHQTGMNWWIKQINLSNSYIDSYDNVEIKIEDGEWYDDTIVDSVRVKFRDKEQIDQCQTSYESTSSSSNFTQSFVPSFEELKRVKILLKPTSNNPNGKINFEIFGPTDDHRITPSSFSGTMVDFGCNYDFDNVYGPEKWIEFEFEDVQLIPDKEYKIFIEKQANNYGSFECCTDENDSLCYKTYGKETNDDFTPDLDVSKNTLHFKVGKSKNNPNPYVENQYFYVENIGDEGSCFEWDASSNKNWITINPDSGILYNGQDIDNKIGQKSIEVNVVYSGKEDGEYLGEIIVTGNEQKETIDVIMTVNSVKSKPKEKQILDFYEMIFSRFSLLKNLLSLI